MAKIIIDEREYEVHEGQNLLHAALSLGLDIPYFCWHPAIGSVGACRQCAVKQFRDDNDTRGKLVMACMTPAADGTRISIDDQDAREFRESVIEWLMINHPHDCPVCDEGGECHLQDMTVMTTHAYRRYAGAKRTFRNQDLGPLVNHEMNRCIQCYRCVRFYRDYAGGRDFDVFGVHSQVYFGRQKDGVLECEFSGNLVEVCPTGVFTDKTLKEHYTRKWDLQTAASICVHCGLGCNTIPGERYGSLRRIYNRYNGEVNGYFLCDRGRFGYEFVNGNRRIRQALARSRSGAAATPVDADEALRSATTLLSKDARVIGIGSPRASIEANFALCALVGPDNFYAGVSEREHSLAALALNIMRDSPCPPASLSEAARSDAVLVLGEDVTQTAPMLALALRQSIRRAPLKKAADFGIPEWDAAGVRHAIQEERGPLYVASLAGTRLDDVATRTFRSSPKDIARLGFAVAHALDVESPPVPVLPDTARALATAIVAALKAAEAPVIVSGSGCGSEEVLRAAANIARALYRKGCPARLCLTANECDSVGLALLGGDSLAAAIEGAKADRPSVIILENDLHRRVDGRSVDALLAAAGHVIVIDHTASDTSDRADVILPASTFAESDGTFVNNEGRAQRFYKVMPPGAEVRESWRWLRDLARATGRSDVGWTTIDDVHAALAAAFPIFEPVLQITPPAGFRIAGLPVARQPARYSGRTAMTASISVHEPQPPEDIDAPLSFSMEGYQSQPPSPLVPRFWAPGWNSVQALNKFQEEVGGPLRGGDPGRRLIEPANADTTPYFKGVPSAAERPPGYTLLVPAYHIFGSEELSAMAPGIARLAPQPYAGLSPDDANGIELKEGEMVEISSGAWSRLLPARIVNSLPGGMVALPVGMPGVEWLDLPAWGELRNAAMRGEQQ
jgi:NADH-quinone oxidoreductase subunit G